MKSAEQEAEMKRQQQELLDRAKIAVLCVEIGAGDYLDQLVRELVPTYLMTIDEQATKPNKTSQRTCHSSGENEGSGLPHKATRLVTSVFLVLTQC